VELKSELDAVVVSVATLDTGEELVLVEVVTSAVEEESKEDTLLVEEMEVLGEEEEEARMRFAPEI